jgi:hypothetical protein
MSAILLLLAMQSTASVDAELAAYREQTRATIRCDGASGEEIVVCGRRNADRYRVPLIEYDPGDPKHEGAPAERERLLARTNNCQEKSVFLVGCGMVGVSASVSAGGTRISGERPIAP